jgi:hypothetical protein
MELLIDFGLKKNCGNNSKNLIQLFPILNLF